MNKSQVNNYLKKNNFVPSKKMGQNFLINDGINKKIISVSDISNNDNVIEIGPGLGAITKHILNETNNFFAIELDKRLYANLRQTFPNLVIYNDDVLSFDFNNYLLELGWNQVKVIANLPYSISSKIILILLNIKQIKDINILVQKEMAERILAKPLTKNYNAFTVLVQSFATIEHKLSVNKNEFVPKPNVDSWFISIKKHDLNLDFEDYSHFLKLCFISRRKKMFNNLLKFYDNKIVRSIFDKFGLDDNIRAEELSKDLFIEMFLFLRGVNG